MDSEFKRLLLGTPVTQPPEVWQLRTGISVMDPDGWRSDNTDFDTPLERDEYVSRACCSTTNYRGDAKDWLIEQAELWRQNRKKTSP